MWRAESGKGRKAGRGQVGSMKSGKEKKWDAEKLGGGARVFKGREQKA